MKKTILPLFIILLCSFALTWRYLNKNQQAPIEQKVVIEDNFEIQETSPTVSPQPSKVKENPKKKLVFEKLYEQSEDPSFLPFDRDGNLYIESVVIDEEWAIAHGDVLVGSRDRVMEIEASAGSLSLAPPKLWPNGIVPFVIETTKISPKQVEDIYIAINLIQKNTPIKFIEAKNHPNKIVFKSGGKHCYSYVGMIGGSQDIVLNQDCGVPQILHETLHALGLYHEQSRPDRDEHIMIMWENIEEQFHEQFKKMPPLHFSLTDVTFDLKSIMMYPPLAFSRSPSEPSILTLDGEYYEPKQTLSAGDIEKLKILYEQND